MSPDTVASILEAVRASWRVANDLEVTLEANPTSVEAGKFSAFRQAGVNRVSIGIQALNDVHLKQLGRLHSVAEAKTALEVARREFDRVSFDLIYARQDQSLSDWQRELREALEMAADHLSLYQLTIEPGTAFGDRYERGRLSGMPEDDDAADMYDATQELCDKAGLPAYEVSNHAGDMGQSRHNLIYWRYGDYIGIGPGAHGRLTLNGNRYATETELMPLMWLSRVEKTGSGETLREAISPTDQASEYAMMSMRLAEGMNLARYAELAGNPLNPARLAGLEDLGLLNLTRDHAIATPSGRRVLNSLLADILTN